jgi:hypothetical protein
MLLDVQFCKGSARSFVHIRLNKILLGKDWRERALLYKPFWLVVSVEY